jgi:hypothetical protein
MADFMVLMKAKDGLGQDCNWNDYIEKLIATGKFRGGSSLSNGVAISNKQQIGGPVVTGFMRFEAESREEVQLMLQGNPLYEAGGDIEVLELVKD